MWGESWKGVRLLCLYMLLCEQFTHPEDPWCVETLKWWNEFHLNFTIHSFACSLHTRKMFSNPPRTNGGSPEPIWDHPRANAWIVRGRRGCEQWPAAEHMDGPVLFPFHVLSPSTVTPPLAPSCQLFCYPPLYFLHHQMWSQSRHFVRRSRMYLCSISSISEDPDHKIFYFFTPSCPTWVIVIQCNQKI